jgi:voltage-gated potassium channel
MFLEGDTHAGKWFEAFILLLIVANVGTFIIGTEESIMTPLAHEYFENLEWISVVIFTIEYIARFYSSPELPAFNSRTQYLTSFFSIVDLLAIVPFYVDIFIPGKMGSTTVVRVFRLFRLFKAEHYVEAFTVFDNVYARNKGLLKTTGFVAFGLWIIMSVLFYYSERDNPDMDDAFNNIPNAMFYTAIFFGGEWCRMDFTWHGQILGGFMIVFGIALYAVPIGILSEGFEAIATERKELQEKRAGTKVVCKNCNKDIKFFRLERLEDD